MSTGREIKKHFNFANIENMNLFQIDIAKVNALMYRNHETLHEII